MASTSLVSEFDLTGAEQVLIYGSWADRYHGTPGPPPNDVDVLVVGSLDRADVYDAADRVPVAYGGPNGVMEWAQTDA